MNTDLLFLLGMGLFYILRRISRQNQEKARQFQLEQLENSSEIEAGGLVTAESVERREPEKKPASIMASISAFIEAEAARQEEIEAPSHSARPVQRTSMTKMPGDSFGGFDASFTPAAEPYTDEWHTETRADWSDQTTDYGFHSAVEEGRNFKPSSTQTLDPFADDGARHAPGLAELDRPTPSHKLGHLYQSKNSLAEAIILSEIIGKPVSRRTRSARRPLS